MENPFRGGVEITVNRYPRRFYLALGHNKWPGIFIRMRNSVLPAVIYSVLKSGSPNVQLVTASSGMGIKPICFPAGEKMYTPALAGPGSAGGFGVLSPAATQRFPRLARHIPSPTRLPPN